MGSLRPYVQQPQPFLDRAGSFPPAGNVRSTQIVPSAMLRTQSSPPTTGNRSPTVSANLSTVPEAPERTSAEGLRSTRSTEAELFVAPSVQMGHWQARAHGDWVDIDDEDTRYVIYK